MSSEPSSEPPEPPREPAVRRRRTVTGLGLIVGGALLGMLAMTALPWFRGSLGGFLVFGTKVSDLRQTISFYRSAPDVYGVISYGISPVFFQWLALVVLIVAALLGAATIGLDDRGSRLVGVASAVVGLAGIVLTAFAIQVVSIDSDKLERAIGTRSNPPGYSDFLGATSIGAWAIVVGFLAIGAGALLASGGRDAMRGLLNGGPEPDEELPEADVPAEPPAPRENW